MKPVGIVYPISQLRFLAGRMHVSTPIEEIEVDIARRASTGKGNWTAHKIHRCAQHIKAQLNQHLRLMRSVNL